MNLMTDEGEIILDFKVDVGDLLRIVGDWFSAKYIHYSDEMFEDYFNHVKGGCLESEGLFSYVTEKTNELIWIWLSIYHTKKKISYKDVKEERIDLIPEWFLKGRYDELEQMITSKFFNYSFSKFDIEYDSSLKYFALSLNLEKEIDDIAFEILAEDVVAYLDNHLTLLKYKEGKLLEPTLAELIFKITW